ncbi:MAG: type II toxin-antitoxin system HicB family antitoxin [Egibacteraceae bacterium]
MATTRFRLTAIYETVENGWVQARVEELPGVITAAPGQAQAEELLLDALREYLLALLDSEHAKANMESGSAQRSALEVTLSA